MTQLREKSEPISRVKIPEKEYTKLLVTTYESRSHKFNLFSRWNPIRLVLRVRTQSEMTPFDWLNQLTHQHLCSQFFALV